MEHFAHGMVRNLGPDENVLGQVLLGLAVILSTLVIHSFGSVETLRVFTRLRSRYELHRRFLRAVFALQAVFVVTMAAHFLNIALWAWVYVLCGEFDRDFNTALYFSGVTYTTLGYGDVLLSSRWHLLGPMEAAGGVLLFGLSGAMLFSLFMHITPDRGPEN